MLFVNRVLQTKMKGNLKCGGCEESALSGWCVQCEEALCSDCVLAHQRVKMTRNHSVVPKDPPSGFTTSLRCASHRQEKLKFFCIPCDELTCRDCQLIDHRGHSFLLLEEALVSQKEQLQRLLHGIREQSISVKSSLLDLDGRLHNINESKLKAKKKLVSLVHNLRMELLVRGHQLFKDVEALYDEEEKSLVNVKTTLSSLLNRHEPITAFIQKILSTEGHCILLHKKQIQKRVEWILSQKTGLSETILRPSLHLNQDVLQMCKTFGSVKAGRVPYTQSNNPENAPKENCSSRLECTSVASSEALSPTQSKTIPEQSPNEESGASRDIMSNSVQSKSHTLAPAGAASISLSVQTHQGQSAQSVLAQVPQAYSQSSSSRSACPQPSQSKQIVRCLSHPQPLNSASLPQSHPSNPGMSSLTSFVHVPPNQNRKKSMSLQQLPLQSGNVLQAASNQSFTPSVAHQISSVQMGSSMSFGTVTIQTPSLTLSHPVSQSVQSSTTVASSAQFGQGVSNPQANILPSCTQQTFPLSQSVCLQSAPPQILHSNLVVPTNLRQAPSAAQNIILQHAQPVVVQRSPILLSILREDNSLHHFTPIPTVNKTPVLSYAPQPTFLLTAPAVVPAVALTGNGKVPNVPTATTSKESEKSTKHVSSQNSYQSAPIASNTATLSSSSSEKVINTVSSKPPLSAPQTPCTPSNLNHGDRATQPSQNTKCELPVQAAADSVCDGDINKHCRASPLTEDPDDNLPSSTVSETDPKELSAVQDQCLPSSTSADPVKAVAISGSPSNNGMSSLPKSPLESPLTMPSTERTSTNKPGCKGFPTSPYQLVIDVPDLEVEGMDIKDVLPTSDSEHISPPNMMLDDDDDDETDISDSEPLQDKVKQIYGRNPELTEKHKMALSVSLEPLPISLPALGSPLPQFKIFSNEQTGAILLKEISESQPKERWLRIRSPPNTVPWLQSSTPPHYPQLNNLLDCAVCLSAGATLICAECGRSFHTHCHVPPVLFRPIQVWVCSLCQDVADDIDPFCRDRLKEPYLSLQDQRRCEQLLLTLMCEEHSYLLYSVNKRTAGFVGFDFIRGRLLGRHTPPYRSSAELVSDLWVLFEILSTNLKKRQLILKLQKSFQERLDVAFGTILHASLLKPPGSGGLKGAPETNTDKDKAKNTLKKMREFLAVNSVAAKKPRTEGTSKDSSSTSH
ncbi:transcription intermediary factor 1-alpha isoform X2 [Hoplias malabaricus]|uniref:transcription intermediary factor 1-alpha isoform X2 n=1 Tax=Hoplias malabaricus TaxID=27720 RepID=UPI0034625D61